MTRLAAIIGVCVWLGRAWAGGPEDDQRLLRVTAGAKPAPAAQAAPITQGGPGAPADELAQQEQTARTEATLSLAKLELVLARKALRENDYRTAALKALRVQALLRQLPPALDTSEFDLQAEGIKLKAARAGVNVDQMGREAADGNAAALPAQDPDLDAKVAGAAHQAKHFGGTNAPGIDTRGDARVLRERAIQAGADDYFGYRPTRQIVDVQAIDAQDRDRLAYEGALETGYRADEARRLTEVDETRVAGSDVVSYPANWPEIVRKREKYKDGVIARTPSWRDKDGREWYVAIYDIQDLIYVPPDFGGVPAGSWDELQLTLDRAYLRQNSQIFSGYADDLAAGIPLLRYFGNSDPAYIGGYRYSAERQQEIVDMIRAFTGMRDDSPKIQAVPPAPGASAPVPGGP